MHPVEAKIGIQVTEVVGPPDPAAYFPTPHLRKGGLACQQDATNQQRTESQMFVHLNRNFWIWFLDEYWFEKDAFQPQK
jgi:hypothetical protein